LAVSSAPAELAQAHSQPEPATARSVGEQIPDVARSPQERVTALVRAGLAAARQASTDAAESHSGSAPAALEQRETRVVARPLAPAPPVSDSVRFRPARGKPVHRFRQRELPVCSALE
jgi:hypothetical protein